MAGPHRPLLLFAETTSWALGLLCLLSWGAFQVEVASTARGDLERFAALQVELGAVPAPDRALWSRARVAAWRKASSDPSPPPVAVLRIPKVRLEVAVLPGTDDRTLDRALGHIEHTALPGANGNAGIAGHRDGFFRGLKDVVAGDLIELETTDGKQVYRVDRTWVVDPDDVSVLRPTPGPALTLVTCYPFYYVGSASHRFIVRAVPVTGSAASLSSHIR
jgi:sortase A